MPDNLCLDIYSRPIFSRSLQSHFVDHFFRKYLYAGFHPKYLHSQKRLHPIKYYRFISTYNTSRLVTYNHSKSHIFFNGITCHFGDLIFFLICLRSVLSIKVSAHAKQLSFFIPVSTTLSAMILPGRFSLPVWTESSHRSMSITH